MDELLPDHPIEHAVQDLEVMVHAMPVQIENAQIHNDEGSPVQSPPVGIGKTVLEDLLGVTGEGLYVWICKPFVILHQSVQAFLKVQVCRVKVTQYDLVFLDGYTFLFLEFLANSADPLLLGFSVVDVVVDLAFADAVGYKKYVLGRIGKGDTWCGNAGEGVLSLGLARRRLAENYLIK